MILHFGLRVRSFGGVGGESLNQPGLGGVGLVYRVGVLFPVPVFLFSVGD